jgi:hypothetical protein
VNSAGTLVSTATGTALVLLALLDVFLTLFSHAQRYALSHSLMRVIWSISHRLPGPAALTLAGPASFLAVVASWAAMLGVGWALIFWPWMPQGFAHSTAPADVGARFLDSLYFSLVTLATLGYGDVSPAEGWLRLVAPLESLLGLGLLTASVSWLLSIFPVLSRRRALAYEICLLREVRRDPNEASPQSLLPAGVYADLTSRLVASERDLVTFPVTYYFRENDARFALPAAMGYLLELAQEARQQDISPEAHFHGGLLLRAIDDFAASIAARFHLPDGGSTSDVLAAYACDHAVGMG